MWILECDGDLLSGKRRWLKPGGRYLFGRTSSGPGSFAFANQKTISRKHMVLEIAKVNPGDCSELNTKSRITVTDTSSTGTFANGELVRKQTKALGGDRNDEEEHIIKLGKCEQTFRIKWYPVVLSFSFSSSETKRKDPLVPIRAKLETTDIKIILPYVHSHTTHVVALKRNTAKGLRALVNGQYIVTNSFIEAVDYAATQTDLGREESLSPLEIDFDASWPDAMQYLPSPGSEPVQRPASTFLPNKLRSTVFDGYTFVFCDQSQFENLQPSIVEGGGKAVLFDLKIGKTTVGELVNYVRKLTGQLSPSDDDNGKRLGNGERVIVVHLRQHKDHIDWIDAFEKEVSQELDLRLIEQNEFLDAILCNDASVLWRHLECEESCDVANMPTPAAPPPTIPIMPERNEPPTEATSSSQNATAQLPSRRWKSTVKRFRGFDDGFDEKSISHQTPETPEKPPEVRKIPDSDNATSADKNVASSEVPSSAGTPRPSISLSKGRRSRRQVIPISETSDSEDMINSLLPAAAAMKRRQLEMEKERRQAGDSVEPSPAPAAESNLKKRARVEEKGKTMTETPKKRIKKTLDVLEAARERRQAQEDAARRDEEYLYASMEGLDIEKMRDVAVIETFNIAQRKSRPPSNCGPVTTSSRWDEQWNGRKNFKKFRRRGDNTVQRTHTVIVPLVEVMKTGLGGGDEYLRQTDIKPPPPRKKTRQMGDEAAKNSVRASDGSSQTQEGSAARLGGKITRSIYSNNEDPASASGSRAGSQTPAKRPRFIFRADEDEDDDSESDSDDELRFRFKRRR